MAGFFPHTGIAFGDYTALTTSFASGILDSIVADVGAGVNGWTVYDDQRRNTVTGTMPTMYVANNGRWSNGNTGAQSWRFVTNSVYFSGNASYGHSTAQQIPLYNTGTAGLQISVDAITWYSAGFWSGGGLTGDGAGILDRPFQGASVNTTNLYMRCPASIVLKCASTASRDFYVQIAMPASGNSGPALFFRTLETWNSGSGTGGGWGAWEGMRLGIAMYGAPTGSNTQYVMCLYPEAFFFWMGTNGTSKATSFYAGNLDTSDGAAISADKGALWSGMSDTSYSGMLKAPGSIWNTTNKWFGNSLLNRSTTNEPASAVVDAYHSTNIRKNASYSTKVRGRSYIDYPWQASVNYDGQVELLDIEIYNAGRTDDVNYDGGAGIWEAREQFRGTIRYLKTFGTNPISKHLVTHQIAGGGTKYICLRAGVTLDGRGGEATVQHQDFMVTMDQSSHFTGPTVAIGQAGEIYLGPSPAPAYGNRIRYLAMPIL